MIARRKPVDNLDLILPLLDFSSKDNFYYLQILQRKKENSELGSNSRVIKNYYLASKEDLLKKYDEIIGLCHVFNARAMIRLNKRNFIKVAFKTLVNVGNVIANGEHKFVKKAYDRACGKGHDDPNKKWILDIDIDFTKEWGNELEEYINAQKPTGTKCLAIIPSRSGIHLITKPFNTEGFSDQFPEVEIHKDNPTNLYIP